MQATVSPVRWDSKKLEVRRLISGPYPRTAQTVQKRADPGGYHWQWRGKPSANLLQALLGFEPLHIAGHGPGQFPTGTAKPPGGKTGTIQGRIISTGLRAAR